MYSNTVLLTKKTNNKKRKDKMNRSIYWDALCTLPKEKGTYILMGATIFSAKYLDFSIQWWFISSLICLVFSFITCVELVKGKQGSEQK